MKQYKTLFFLCGLMVMTACTKVLDKRDLNAINQDDVWNDLELATAAISNIYAQSLPEWSTEYADYSEESDGGGSYMYGQLTENSVNYWPYNQIRDINVMLANVSQGSLKDADKKQ